MTRDDGSVALLRAVLARSGLSKQDFARQLMVRDPATIRRWLAGEIEMPAVVRRRLGELYDAQEGAP